ncbi:D-3-phosphoglycerate dehydrogenase 1, chloroplastic-like protein [Tanacetum coccineum]
MLEQQNLSLIGETQLVVVMELSEVDMHVEEQKVTYSLQAKESIKKGSTSGIRACALRNFDLKVMEFETAQINTTAKLPILKLGDYEMWEMRIKQYFQMSVPVTANEKINKKNDVKSRSLLLMSIPNEHQLTFSQYDDAKTMFAAIKTQFGGSKKLVSRLAILGVVITQEDLNSRLVELSKGCPRLRKLYLWDCPFSKQAVATFVFNIHPLSYIWLRFGFEDDLVLTRPTFTAEVLTELTPYVTLAEKLHKLAVEFVADGSGLGSVKITYTSSRATDKIDTSLVRAMLAKGICVNEEQVIVGASSDKPLEIIKVQIANAESRLAGEIKVEGRVKDGIVTLSYHIH